MFKGLCCATNPALWRAAGSLVRAGGTGVVLLGSVWRGRTGSSPPAAGFWGPNLTSILEKKGSGMSHVGPGMEFVDPSTSVPTQLLMALSTPTELVKGL